ncbi:MAG: glutaredoxin [Paenibacillaceae bacterium]|uniref:glutaredoxin family protein n=1 Tax=Paenibacillus cymbidii TaxID=1639034 RepID=UPI00107FF262|nr:glutaredoxin domain-containing protein [Paenibacillus cymbidii]MBO9605252.1 glutaredoxin [Paenibacillaceae bacterium]
MKLYTKTVCPKCMWIKSEIARTDLAIEIINIDHDEAARERLIEVGMLSLPVMEADGEFIHDPNEMMKRVEQLTV